MENEKLLSLPTRPLKKKDSVDSSYIEAIYLAQPVQYAGSMRTFFRKDDGFELTKSDGNIRVYSPEKGYGKELEIGFSNIAAVLWVR